MAKDDELIEVLDRAVALLISLKRSARKEQFDKRTSSNIVDEVRTFERSIAGMVVDPEPADQKSGLKCPVCRASINVTLS